MTEWPEKAVPDLDIYRIATPNPYSTATTNCYFVDCNQPALIDTGLATEEAYKIIADALSNLGRRIPDLKRIILTHGHADHRALARRIQEESGADVLCHRLEASKVITLTDSEKAASHNRSKEYFISIGVPDEFLSGLVGISKNPSIIPKVDTTSFLSDEDEISLGNQKLRALHTPGHSSGSICLHEENSGALFTGDTILPDSAITALLEIDMILDERNYNGLKKHLDSLERILQMNPVIVLPGHGNSIGDCRSIVDAVIDRHRKRRRHIMRALRNGPRTPYQICRSVFLFTPTDDLYLALSEIVGNLGIMVEEGSVSHFKEKGVLLYKKV